MRDMIRLIRPKHWIKNILIFIPAFFSRTLWEKKVFENLILGFFCFSFVSSIVYIFNDLIDIQKDRRHEEKCKRPLASGAVSKKTAGIEACLLGIGAIVLGSLIRCEQPYIHIFWSVFYLFMNIAYSIKLKNMPIVDVAVLATGFIIRIFYGAAVSEVMASSWLCLTVMSFALYMAMGKRRNELNKLGGNSTRKVLQYYDVEILDKYMVISTTLGIVFYAFWAGIVITNKWVIWTVPLVLFIIMKYELIIKGNSYGDPVEVLLSDRILCTLVVIYAIIMFLFMYILQ